MLVDIVNKNGEKTGEIELDDKVFACEPNEHAMHMAVVQTLANRRRGTHKTKVRSEVRGGGKKPWRQKGRGTARAGSTRSPLWTGGGTIHGPKPHEYKFKLTKKMKRLARKSALSTRFGEGNIVLVEDFSFDEIKTKNMVETLGKLGLDGEKTLVAVSDADKNLLLSARNIPRLTMNAGDKISTYDILNHKKLLIFKSAVEKIENALK